MSSTVSEDAKINELYARAAAQAGRSRLQTQDQPALCGRCVYGMVFRLSNPPVTQVKCTFVDWYLPTTVVECTKFKAVSTMDLDDMHRLAVVIDVKRSPGFGRNGEGE